MTRKLGIALAASVVLLAGCGGAAERPSVDEISSVLQEGGDIGGQEVSFPEEQADCVAEIFHSSDISDEGLAAMVEKDEDYQASEEDEAALTDMMGNEDIAACVSTE